jgi:hypothetical protein
MKWKYYKDSKEWYVRYGEGDSVQGFDIKKQDGKYRLIRDYFVIVGRFKKLSSAKKVAELLING